MGYRVSIVGATGAVGEEFLRVLERRQFPVDRMRLFASSRSVGRNLTFRKKEIPIEAYAAGAVRGEQIVFLSAGSEFSLQHAREMSEGGALVIDNSSAFRLDPQVPLVIPEINPERLQGHQGIVANPNCTTAILLMALTPLHRIARARRVVVATYQSASGRGARGLAELEGGLAAALRGDSVAASAFPHPLAMNVIPQVDGFLEGGSTKEENKVLRETQRILEDPQILMDITCVRVPVRRCHSEAVTVEFERLLTVEEARKAWLAFPGLRVLDEPERGIYPHPLSADGKDEVFVGRCRPSLAFERGLSFWCVGDQLLKGAALNAVQIAEAALGVRSPVVSGGKAWI